MLSNTEAELVPRKKFHPDWLAFMVLKILSKATRGKKLIIKEKLRAVEIGDIAGYFGGHILLLLPVYLNVSFTTLTDSYFIYLKNINTDIYVHFKIKGLQNNVNLSSRIQREAENQKTDTKDTFLWRYSASLVDLVSGS